MRLIFYYLAHRNAGHYFDFFPTEGYYRLLKRMVEAGIVDEALVLIESGQILKPVNYMPGLVGHAVPGIENVPGGIRPDDIIWVRGGWKSWFPFLEKLHDENHRLLFYGANTGRERWPIWDIVFDDLAGKDFVDSADRLHLDFRKPTNPEIFRPMKREREYDLCIGASHIHDKKGQWRGVETAIAYQEIFGKKLKCVMPGAVRRGVRTNEIAAKIRDHGLDITMPGMLPRAELAKVLNESKIFAHLGSSGQGDRGVLEAMRCGCPLIIGFPAYHAPFTYENRDITYVPDDPDWFEMLAIMVRKLLRTATEDKRAEVFKYHEKECGLDTVIIPKMDRLFSLFSNGGHHEKV